MIDQTRAEGEPNEQEKAQQAPQSIAVPQATAISQQTIKPQQEASRSKFTQTRETMWLKVVRFFRECRRVVKVIRKPNKEEFLTTVKVSALGVAIIGLIGFVLSVVQQLILRK